MLIFTFRRILYKTSEWKGWFVDGELSFKL